MKYAISTLGCPEWDLDEIIAKLPEMGIYNLDVRGIKDDLDVTLSPDFTTKAAETKAKLDAAKIKIVGISSSIMLCDVNRFDENILEAERTIKCALAFGASTIRVFGYGQITEENRAEAAATGRKCLAKILELPDADKILWCFETHDYWLKVKNLRMVLDAFPQKNVGVVWDIENYLHSSGESAEYFCAELGKRVFNTHIKDGITDAEGKVVSVPPGSGETHVAVAEAVRCLRKIGYTGMLTLEYEKRWQRNIAPADVAFPAFVEWVKNNNFC